MSGKIKSSQVKLSNRDPLDESVRLARVSLSNKPPPPEREGCAHVRRFPYLTKIVANKRAYEKHRLIHVLVRL